MNLVSHFSKYYNCLTANLDEPPMSSIAKQILPVNGKLIVRTEESKNKLITNTTSEKPASFAIMRDYGNFMLYKNSSSIFLITAWA